MFLFKNIKKGNSPSLKFDSGDEEDETAESEALLQCFSSFLSVAPSYTLNEKHPNLYIAKIYILGLNL